LKVRVSLRREANRTVRNIQLAAAFDPCHKATCIMNGSICRICFDGSICGTYFLICYICKLCAYCLVVAFTFILILSPDS
jgi:hypothetical protein